MRRRVKTKQVSGGQKAGAADFVEHAQRTPSHGISGLSYFDRKY